MRQVVFSSVMRWLRYDLEGRRHHLPELLRGVRLALLPSECLLEAVACEELVMADKRSRCASSRGCMNQYNKIPFQRATGDYKNTPEDAACITPVPPALLAVFKLKLHQQQQSTRHRKPDEESPAAHKETLFSLRLLIHIRGLIWCAGL